MKTEWRNGSSWSTREAPWLDIVDADDGYYVVHIDSPAVELVLQIEGEELLLGRVESETRRPHLHCSRLPAANRASGWLSYIGTIACFTCMCVCIYVYIYIYINLWMERRDCLESLWGSPEENFPRGYVEKGSSPSNCIFSSGSSSEGFSQRTGELNRTANRTELNWIEKKSIRDELVII